MAALDHEGWHGLSLVGEEDFLAGRDGKGGAGAPAVDADFEHAVAPDIHQRLTGGDVGKRIAESEQKAVREAQAQPPAGESRRGAMGKPGLEKQLVRLRLQDADGGNEVAKAVGMQDLTPNARAFDELQFREREALGVARYRPNLIQSQPVGQQGSGRGENVAPMESEARRSCPETF